MATKARPDVGYFQIIEAMLVGFLLLGAVFLAIGFSAPPPPSSTAGTEELEQVTWDAVESMNDLFVHDSAFSNSTLSRAVADALAGDTTSLVASMREFFPAGSAFNIYLNNGFERMTVYESREPQGQTVGISFPFEPRWNYVFTAPDLEVYDAAGTATAMGLTMIPVHNSNLVRDGGILLEAEVSGIQSWLPGQLDRSGAELDFSDHAFTSFVQGGVQAGADYPSASIWMNCKQLSVGPPPVETTVPCYALDMSTEPDQGREPELEGRILFTVHNYGVGDLPAGTEITVQFPVGLEVSDARDIWGANAWMNARVLGAGPNPQAVKATLAAALAQGEEAQLRVNLNKTDDRYAFKIVNARLAGAAASSSQFLLRVEAKEAGAYTGGDSRVVLLSGPQPAGSATGPGASTPPARWAVVMSMPFGEGRVDSLELLLPHGEDVFTGASFPADFAVGDGAYAAGLFKDEDLLVESGSAVRWSTTNHEIGAYHFFEFQVELTGNGVYTQASPHFPRATPRPLFEAYEPMPFFDQTEQGVWWREEPPRTSELPGFGKGFVIGSSVDKQIDGRLAYRNKLLEGSSDYVLADLIVGAEAQQAALKDAVRSARLTIDPTIVPIGETVRVTLDADDLATYLAETIGLDDVEIVTRIYPPWGLRDKIPIAEEEHHSASGILATAFDLEASFLNGDSSQDIVVASGDGNVYGISGATGKLIPGSTYVLPETGVTDIGANLLARGHDATSEVFAVGTQSGAGRIYFLDHDIDAYADPWNGAKPEPAQATLGVNATTDMTGDGVPEIFVTHTSVEGDTNAAGNSRLAIYDGATGEILPGWEDAATPTSSGFYDAPTLVHGEATELGMGKVGPNAVDGVFANTGMQASLGMSEISIDPNDLLDPEGPPNPLEWAPEVTVGLYDAGLVAATEDGKYAWNFTGGRFTRVLRADDVPTGGKWTGIVAGGGDGWVYGLSGRKAITPVTGFEWGGVTGFTDVSMANPLEGYMAAPIGVLYSTRDGWTTYDPYTVQVVGGQGTVEKTKNFPGVRAVDTLDADIYTADAQVSWWAGDAGLLLRSTDRVTTVTALTTAGQLQASLYVDPGSTSVTLVDLTSVNLALVNFEDVLAVSSSEAWFVGGAVNGSSVNNKGYIVHTTDSGTTLQVTEVICRDSLLQQLNQPCAIHSVDSDGSTLWFTGDMGIVLVQNSNGAASYVSITTPGSGALVSGSSPSGARVKLLLDAAEAARLDKVAVTWDPLAGSNWMSMVTIGGTKVWDTTLGAAYVSGTFLAGSGAGPGAILDVKGYVDSVLTPATTQNSISGAVDMRFGPFRKTNDPGLGGYYNTAQLPTNLDHVYATVTYSDGTQDVFRLNVDTATGTEDAGLALITPSAAGYTVPTTCFGAADTACGPYYDIDIEEVTGGLAYRRATHKLCFTEADANLVFDWYDPVYISNGCDLVSANDIRLANPVMAGYALGSQVVALDTDFGAPMHVMPGAFRFDDVDGSSSFTSGDLLYWDSDDSGAVSVGDLLLSSASAGTPIQSGNANINRSLKDTHGVLSYDDVDESGTYGSGDTEYFDADNSGSMTLYDVRLSGAGFGTVLATSDLPVQKIGVIVGRPQVAGGGLKAQSSIVRLDADTWAGVTSPVSTALRGVSMSSDDPTRYVAVGLNDRVLTSRDSGLTWTDMPKVYDVASGQNAPLYAVDYTHPDAPIIVGGKTTGIQWILDGYTEWGRATTRDLAPSMDTVSKVRIDPDDLVVSLGGGHVADVHIDLAQADGSWLRVYDANLGDPWTAADEESAPDMPDAVQFTLPAPVSEVQLRVTLTTPLIGFSKFSPQLAGSLDLSLWAPGNSGAADLVTTAALTDATLFAEGEDTLDWDTTHGIVRLVAVHNPWVMKLGNPNGADYPLITSGLYGTRVGDMGLSFDGSILYVGTEGIYEIGAVEGAAASGWDNTLYAIDVATGQLIDSWAYPQFAHPNQATEPDPITFVRVDAAGVYVLSEDNSAGAAAARADGVVAWYVRDGAYDPDLFHALGGGKTVHDAVAARVLDPYAPWELVLAYDEITATSGTVIALDGDVLTQVWSARPNEKGVFDFTWDAPTSAMYGAYVLETTISWDLGTDFGGDGGLIQTARVFNAFTVTPPTGEIMHSPTYNLEVITWLQDWG